MRKGSRLQRASGAARRALRAAASSVKTAALIASLWLAFSVADAEAWALAVLTLGSFVSGAGASANGVRFSEPTAVETSGAQASAAAGACVPSTERRDVGLLDFISSSWKYLTRPSEQTPWGRAIGIGDRPPGSTGLLEFATRSLKTPVFTGLLKPPGGGGRMPYGYGSGSFVGGGGGGSLNDILSSVRNLTGGGSYFASPGAGTPGMQGPYHRRRRRGGITARDLASFRRVANLIRRYSAPVRHMRTHPRRGFRR